MLYVLQVTCSEPETRLGETLPRAGQVELEQYDPTYFSMTQENIPPESWRAREADIQVVALGTTRGRRGNLPACRHVTKDRPEEINKTCSVPPRLSVLLYSPLFDSKSF